MDNRTSQWASVAVLLGNEESIENPPYKLDLTYEAVSHWKEQREKGKCWEPRYDETILRQAETFLRLLNKEKPPFEPRQPEDYRFAYAFGLITKEEGEARWPSLRGHESNRLEEQDAIYSKDHRVIQAYAMRQKVNGKEIKVKYPESVNKSWPQFWKFLTDSPYLLYYLK